MVTNATALLDRSKVTREEWLALHDQHIGGSDAAAVIGLSKYRSPMSVYVTKKHMLPHPAENEYMRWGNLLEGLIRSEFPKDFEEQEGKPITVIEDTNMYESSDRPYMCADPDGLVRLDGQLGLGLLEIKTTTTRAAGEWKDDTIPDEYFAQVQHNMYVLHLRWALVVVLMDKRLMWRIVPRREGFLEELLAAEKEWWERFYLPNEMPAPSGMEIDSDVLNALYPESEDRDVEIPHMEDLALRYQELGKDARQAEEERREIQQIFLKEMGNARRAFAGKARITRSIYTTSRLDVEALKKEHPVIAARFQRESQASRLTITVPKGEEVAIES